MSKQTVVSGIRATGPLHLGNYLGAAKQFLEMQSLGHRSFFFIADLHALTTPFTPKNLHKDTLEVVTDLLALGLDPNKCTLFIQNHVSEHTELAWILNCLTPLPELYRMTQFKDKSEDKESTLAGLLNYPTLMAADILLYKPTLVPVGEDQMQHIELTRDLAKKFNRKFGDIFPLPKNYLLKPIRLMSLSNPDKKMSKTGDTPLYINDTPEEIEKKVKKAVTASTGGSTNKGVDNLFYLLEIFASEDEYNTFVKQEKDGVIKYSELKTTLSSRIAEYFADFRAKKASLAKDKDYIADILAEGARKARLTASHTLEEVKYKIGLV